MKKTDTFLIEYFRKLPDDGIKFLTGRLTMRLRGDVPDALDYLSRNREVDYWLGTAKTSNELFDMVDSVYQYVDKEFARRFES